MISYIESKSVSVVMPSHLKEYDRCAKNRDIKLRRAINSFLGQTYFNKYLILVADGCEQTVKIYVEEYQQFFTNIFCVPIPKQPMFSGMMRQAGLNKAKEIGTNFTCYLDSDDRLGTNHLQNIMNQVDDENEFYYFDEYQFREGSFKKRNASLHHGNIGTPCILHKTNIECEWEGNGYGVDDQDFIMNKLIKLKNKKIENGEYYLCHDPNLGYDI